MISVIKPPFLWSRFIVLAYLFNQAISGELWFNSDIYGWACMRAASFQALLSARQKGGLRLFSVEAGGATYELLAR